MSDQQELQQRREALAEAVNSHDREAVLSFVDPSYVAKTRRGVSVGYKDMASMVEGCSPREATTMRPWRLSKSK